MDMSLKTVRGSERFCTEKVPFSRSQQTHFHERTERTQFFQSLRGVYHLKVPNLVIVFRACRSPRPSKRFGEQLGPSSDGTLAFWSLSKA